MTTHPRRAATSGNRHPLRAMRPHSVLNTGTLIALVLACLASAGALRALDAAETAGGSAGGSSAAMAGLAGQDSASSSPPNTVLAAAGSGEIAVPAFVSTDWTASRIGDSNLRVLDARPSLRDYMGAHIPGAQPLAVETLRSSEAGVPGQIFPPEIVHVIAGRLGLTPSGPIVVYGAGADTDAAFVASVLRMAGYSQVGILDGGLARWTKEGRRVTADRMRVVPTRPAQKPLANALALLEDVQSSVGKEGVTILDVRPPEQFDAGRIPGAVNRFWKKDLVPEGRPGEGLLRSREELESEYRALGLSPDRPVIVYCNTGHMASSVFYALRYWLGWTGVRFYNGSWAEWSMDPNRPRETGKGAAEDRGSGPRSSESSTEHKTDAAPARVEAAKEAAALERARAAGDELTKALLSRLMTEMGRAGPAGAVKVCSEEAQRIASSLSTPSRRVRRVSMKARNPLNEPNPWETERLGELEALHAKGELPDEYTRIVTEGGSRVLRYLKPIVVRKTCLACHGLSDALAPEVREILKARYPADRATGYKAGDLRGAVSVAETLD